MLGAVDLGITDDGEGAGHEQAAQIAVTLFTDTAEPIPTLLECCFGINPIRPRSCDLTGRFWDRRHLPLERWRAADRRQECS